MTTAHANSYPDLTIAERIRIARTRAGLDQRELANRLGVRQATVSSWETGRTTPALDLAAGVARETGCSIEWLAGLPSRSRCVSPVDELARPTLTLVRGGRVEDVWTGQQILPLRSNSGHLSVV